MFGASKIYIPNTFTPNGDGKNDVFRPWMFFVQDVPLNKNQDYAFTIFNRWGEILFQTDKIDQGRSWTRESLNSTEPQGVYGYKIQVYGIDGMSYF